MPARAILALMALLAPATAATPELSGPNPCEPEGYDDRACQAATLSLERALAQDPSLDQVRFTLAEAYRAAAFAHLPKDQLRKSLYDKALGQYRTLADAGSRNAQVYLRLAEREERLDERRTLLEKAASLDPKQAEALSMLPSAELRAGRVDDALAAWSRYSTLAPDRERDEDISWAVSLLAAGRKEDSVAVLRRVLGEVKAEPREIRCKLTLPVDPAAFAFAAEVAGEVTRVRPFCTRMDHFFRAARLERSDYAGAIREATSQLAENPKPEQTWFLLERLYSASGDEPKATDTIREYFKQEDDPVARCTSFRALPERARNRLEEAVRSSLAATCGK